MTPQKWSRDNECPQRGQDGLKEDTIRKSQFSETQIAGFLQEHAAGGNTTELCRRIGVTPQTLDRWKKHDGGVSAAEVTRLKALESENARLKRVVAEQALDLPIVQELRQKNF